MHLWCIADILPRAVCVCGPFVNDEGENVISWTTLSPYILLLVLLLCLCAFAPSNGALRTTRASKFGEGLHHGCAAKAGIKPVETDRQTGKPPVPKPPPPTAVAV